MKTKFHSNYITRFNKGRFLRTFFVKDSKENVQLKVKEEYNNFKVHIWYPLCT
ncbi:hypothetical protein Hdeb2414_s0016g00473091 [Helianthus debilis subsp. tardiflorus]